MKKETLNDAAERYAEHQLTGMSDKTAKFECINDFISGAKWQAERISLMEIELNHTKTLLESCEKALDDRDKKAERMYTEEDIKKSFEAGRKGYMRGSLLNKEYFFAWKSFKLWFEQFKKK